MGDTLCPLPEPLWKRILALEFVDMSDLQPEAWLFEDGTHEKGIASIFRKRKEPVTEILTWVQCYNAMVAVLAERYPQFIQHFLAYQSHIVRSYKKSRALEWVAYDMAYRRKAAYTKSLNWAIIDQNLSATWFSGMGRPPCCVQCLSDDHSAATCPRLGDNIFASLAPAISQWAISAQALTTEQWVTPQRVLPSQAQYPRRSPAISTPLLAPQIQTEQPLCGLYNAAEGPRCTYNPCRFSHRCRNWG